MSSGWEEYGVERLGKSRWKGTSMGGRNVYNGEVRSFFLKKSKTAFIGVQFVQYFPWQVFTVYNWRKTFHISVSALSSLLKVQVFPVASVTGGLDL